MGISSGKKLKAPDPLKLNSATTLLTCHAEKKSILVCLMHHSPSPMNSVGKKLGINLVKTVRKTAEYLWEWKFSRYGLRLPPGLTSFFKNSLCVFKYCLSQSCSGQRSIILHSVDMLKISAQSKFGEWKKFRCQLCLFTEQVNFQAEYLS